MPMRPDAPLESAIFERAGLTPRVRGGLSLVSAVELPALLDAAAYLGVGILGIESFEVDDGVVRPLMDWILDLGAQPDVAASLRDARRFADSLLGASNLWVEVVFADAAPS